MGTNASAYRAGGLASRKPEIFPHITNKTPAPGRRGETDKRGAKEILFLVSFLI